MDLNSVQKIREKFGDKVVELWEKSPGRVYVTVKKQDIKDIVSYLFDDLGGRLMTISALDTRPGIEILYHFSFDSQSKVVTVRTLVPVPFPEIETVSLVVPAAEYIEREMHDLFGVNFKNHPNLKRFILADDWPEGVYPYRREHKGQFPYRTEEEQYPYREGEK